MAQEDYTIDNASGATVRADINSTLSAIVSQNSGASAPSTTFAYMLWADTTNGVLKRRNAANSGWIVLGPLSSSMVQAKSANYTVALSDFGTLIDCTSGTFTLALTAAATLGDGFWVDIRNSGSGTVTIDPDASETIDGSATLSLPAGDSCRVWCNGSAFKTVRGAGLGVINTFTASQNIQSVDAGAGPAPALTLDRNSASPAINDQIGIVNFNGRNSAGGALTYADIACVIGNPTSGSEASRLDFQTYVSGASLQRMFLGAGLNMQGASGGDMGGGTINATAVYDDGVLLTCYVPEFVVKGSLDLAKWDASVCEGAAKHEPAHSFAARAKQALDVDAYAKHWKTNGYLLGMPSPAEWDAAGKKMSAGNIIQRLWETVEVQAAHIDALNARLKALEAKK